MNVDVPKKSATVIFKSTDEGGVLFCSRTEVYFGLNQVGVSIWSALPDAVSKSPTVDSLLDTLHDVYPDVDRDSLAADVDEFLKALEESELVSYDRPEEV